MIQNWSLPLKLKVLAISVLLIDFFRPLLNLHSLYTVSKCESQVQMNKYVTNIEVRALPVFPLPLNSL